MTEQGAHVQVTGDSQIGIMPIFPNNWCGAERIVNRHDKVLFYLWVVIYILGFHDYGTGFTLTIKEAMDSMTAALTLCSNLENLDYRHIQLRQCNQGSPSTRPEEPDAPVMEEMEFEDDDFEIHLDEDLCLFIHHIYS